MTSGFKNYMSYQYKKSQMNKWWSIHHSQKSYASQAFFSRRNSNYPGHCNWSVTGYLHTLTLHTKLIKHYLIYTYTHSSNIIFHIFEEIKNRYIKLQINSKTFPFNCLDFSFVMDAKKTRSAKPCMSLHNTVVWHSVAELKTTRNLYIQTPSIKLTHEFSALSDGNYNFL